MTTFETLNSLDGAALAKALAGPPEDVANLLRTAAQGGAIEAQLRLGQMLLDGIGIRRDAGEALRWFVAAATAGHPMGMNMVGRCFEHGWGTAPEATRAADWYRAAADRGLDWGLYNLATLLTLGCGVAEDRPQALALFRNAAGLGHAKSLSMIGTFYEDGWVVGRDMAEAAVWYRRGAEAGDFRGQFNHARMLIGAGQIEEAVVWLRRVPETATPNFMIQLRTWLGEQADERLVTLALDL